MIRVYVLAAWAIGLTSTAIAADWPQWMGPERDNVWREEGIVAELPADGPKVAWRAPVSGGYAGPAVANGKVYIADYVTDADVNVANFERKESTGTALPRRSHW
jgi:outer membrane protein assembly factor BamB